MRKPSGERGIASKRTCAKKGIGMGKVILRGHHNIQKMKRGGKAP